MRGPVIFEEGNWSPSAWNAWRRGGRWSSEGKGKPRVLRNEKTSAAERKEINRRWPVRFLSCDTREAPDVSNAEAAFVAADRGLGLAHMMRIAVTGSMGQVATALIAEAGRAFEIVLLGRRVFLLEDRGAVLAGLKAARPDVVMSTHAYTSVDQAEAEERPRNRHQRRGGGPRGGSRRTDRRAAVAALRLITYSTARSIAPTARTIRPIPRSAYGRSKLHRREARRRALRQQRAFLRTAWLFSPYGTNFVLHHACTSTRRAGDEVSVVADQRGAIRPLPSTSPQACSLSPG